MSRYEDSFILKDEVTRSLQKINSSLENFNSKLKGSEVQLSNLQSKTASIKKLGKGMQDFGNKMTVGVTLPIIGAVTYASKMGMEFQDAEMRLQTMLGSAEKGTAMFNKIQEMGAQTPYESKDLLQATNTLLGFGVAEKKVLPIMQQLGDISGGNADRFQHLALAFAQVSAAGKLQGQDLNQMISAGFNPLQAIAERTGKSVGYWKEQMSKGAVTLEMVEQAMEDVTGPGGRFYKMMDKMSKTASGKWSTMMDNFNIAMADLGEVLLPYVTKGIEFLTSVFEKFTKLSPGIQKMILLFGGVLAIVGPLTSGFGTLITTILGINAIIGAGLIPVIGTALLTGAAWIGGIVAIILALKALWEMLKLTVSWIEHFNKMKIKTVKTDFNNKELQKLAGLQASMGEKSFSERYGQNISKQVSSYRQSQIKNTTNNTTTNNNFYGNINSSGSLMLDNIINKGGNVPAFS